MDRASPHARLIQLTGHLRCNARDKRLDDLDAMAAASAKGLASPEVQSNMASGNFSFVGRMIMRRLF